MAVGQILSLTPLALSGLSARATNHSAQCYVVDELNPAFAAGYVSSASRSTKIYLWNGTAGDVLISDVTAEEAGGISVSGLIAGDVISSKGSVAVVFEVTKYGPLDFDARFVFESSCALTPDFTITGTRPLFASDQPLPITLNEAVAEAYSYPSAGDTFYDTLEFSSSSAGDSIRVVHSDEDLDTPQGLFTACKFGCSHPETESGVVGAMEITVDFLPMDAQKWIMNACKTRGQVTVYWRQYLGHDMEPDAHYPVPLNITNVDQTALGVKATASFPMLTSMKFPRRIMTTSVLPGGRA